MFLWISHLQDVAIIHGVFFRIQNSLFYIGRDPLRFHPRRKTIPRFAGRIIIIKKKKT